LAVYICKDSASSITATIITSNTMPLANPLLFLSTTESRDAVAAVLRKDRLLAELAVNAPASLTRFVHSAVGGGLSSTFGTRLIALLASIVASLPHNAEQVRNGFTSFHVRWIMNPDVSGAVARRLTEGLTNFLDIALKFLAVGHSDTVALT
jgi:hypothetical protein